MPAAKKSSSKSRAATKSSAAKKPASVKRAPAKSHGATSVKRISTPPVRSFRPTKLNEPFLTFRITHQTVYWLILAIVVVSLAAWVLSISIKVQGIYDQIDGITHATENMRVLPKGS